MPFHCIWPICTYSCAWNRWNWCTLVVAVYCSRFDGFAATSAASLMGERKIKRLELITNSNGPFDCNQHRISRSRSRRFHCSVVKRALAGNGFGVNQHCTWTRDKFRQSDMVYSRLIPFHFIGSVGGLRECISIYFLSAKCPKAHPVNAKL